MSLSTPASSKYSAADLEKELRREIIPAFEERTKALKKEMREMGFDGSPDDPAYYHYKIQKGFAALPSDEELKAKTFEVMGVVPLISK
jgi:hypothetical protein